jgi:hypothetical protein
MLKRKGGPTVVIAIGAPKPGPMQERMQERKHERMMAEENGATGEPSSGPSMSGAEDTSKLSKQDAARVAEIRAEMAALKAELADLLASESESDGASESESEDEYAD